jgi:hypothetical protein
MIDRVGSHSETMIRGRYAIRHVALTPGAEYSTTWESLMAVTERIDREGAIPLGRIIFADV